MKYICKKTDMIDTFDAWEKLIVGFDCKWCGKHLDLHYEESWDGEREEYDFWLIDEDHELI